MKKKYVKSSSCLNCSAELNGENYCPECGQANDSRFPTLKDFVGESISNFIALDGRFLQTLQTLFHKPGYLAKEFVDGRRVKYMSPVRIYFLSSLVLLFVLNMEKGRNKIVQIQDSPSESKEEKVEVKLAEISPSEEIENEDLMEMGFFELFVEMYEFTKLHPNLSTKEGLINMQVEESWMNENLYNMATKASTMDDEEFSRYFYSKLFWVLFLFLPFFAFFLKLMYIRRKFLYLEHLFFSFYAQSAFFILISLGIIAASIFNHSSFIVLTVLLFAVYLWVALKTFYRQGWWKTTFKFMLINGGFVFFSIYFLSLAALVSFIIY